MVTIITPAYNAAQYIVETVESVLNQDFTGSLEYLILDDGSTDNTLEKLKPYSNRATIISHENMGEQATVNKGLAMAKYDTVAIVNADDPIEEQLISTAVNLLQNNPKLVAVYPDWRKIDCHGQEIEQIQTPEYNYIMMIEEFYNFLGPGVFFRKSALGKECFRNPLYKYAGDFEFWLRLGLKGPMQRIPKMLATWRHHDEGASQKCINEQMALDRIAVIKNFFERSDLPAEIYPKKRQALSAAYYNAGVLALHNPNIKGRYYFLLSFIYKLFWPRDFSLLQKRNLKYIAYICARPFSYIIYDIWKTIYRKNVSTEIYQDKYLKKFFS